MVWNKIDGRILPSCQYKQNTEILRDQVEHFSMPDYGSVELLMGNVVFQPQLLMGYLNLAKKASNFLQLNIDIESSISSTSLDSIAQYFSPYATSHQDFNTMFRDYGTDPSDDFNIPNHVPLGIDVRLKSYAWNFSFADAFVILSYTIINQSDQTIENLYLVYGQMLLLQI